MTTRVARSVDAALELSVVGGFSRLGIALRSRFDGWSELGRLDDRRVLITGATSGLGLAMATAVATLGGDVVLLARDESKAERVATMLRHDHRATVEVVVADMSDLAAVERAAATVRAAGRLDAIVHNAGALLAARSTTPAGDETTFATHVLGPYLLTYRLLDVLRQSTDPRVVVMSSGGLYTQPLLVDTWNRDDGHYRGSVAYARAKRAQVSLVELHRESFAACGVLLAACHPGWADTEGVRQSLPAFRRVTRPILRTPAQGADTALWLVTAPRSEIPAATLFSDRSERPLHRTNRTRASDTPAARAALDAWCRARFGLVEE